MIQLRADGASEPVLLTGDAYTPVASLVHYGDEADRDVLPAAAAFGSPSRHDQNPAFVYLAGLSPGSRRTMAGALTRIAAIASGGQAGIETMPWSSLRFQHTTAVRSRLAEEYGAATVNKMLCALRGTLKSAWRLGLLSAEDLHRACDLPAVPGETLPAGRSLSGGEIAALLGVCRADAKQGKAAGVRDAALVSLLYGCGLRRAEAAALTLGDFTATATVADDAVGGAGGGALKIRGKRNKQRLVPVVGGAGRALADWLRIRNPNDGDSGAVETSSGGGSLFVPIRKGKGGGTLTLGRGMTTQAIYGILVGRARQAGVAHFSPHDFRRTFVGDLLDRGADIATVQKLAGHASVNTTARYDRRGEAAQRKAAELLHVPY